MDQTQVLQLRNVFSASYINLSIRMVWHLDWQTDKQTDRQSNFA